MFAQPELFACCLVFSVVLGGCASATDRFNRAAEAAGLVSSWIEGRGLRHVVFRPPEASAGAGPLHVYLTGDGTPYVRRTLRAADPTPRHPLVLDLMALDPAPRLLLGRPCYHGLAQSAGCGSDLWTQARFGEQVVGSMAAALRQIAPDETPVVLIGFSGGGALAVLLARRLSNVVGVVTLAGNLDIDAWADLHGHSRLAGSENPAKGTALPSRINQLHAAGGDDRVVPQTLVRPAVARLGGRMIVFPDATHQRRWRYHWPEILDEVGRWEASAAAR